MGIVQNEVENRSNITTAEPHALSPIQFLPASDVASVRHRTRRRLGLAWLTKVFRGFTLVSDSTPLNGFISISLRNSDFMVTAQVLSIKNLNIDFRSSAVFSCSKKVEIFFFLARED